MSRLVFIQTALLKRLRLTINVDEQKIFIINNRVEHSRNAYLEK